MEHRQNGDFNSGQRGGSTSGWTITRSFVTPLYMCLGWWCHIQFNWNQTTTGVVRAFAPIYVGGLNSVINSVNTRNPSGFRLLRVQSPFQLIWGALRCQVSSSRRLGWYTGRHRLDQLSVSSG